MTNSNQDPSEFNRVSGETFKKGGQRATMLLGDLTKLLINFIRSMFKMFMGK